MAETPTYVIQLQGSAGFCLGVENASAGEFLVLRSITGTGTPTEQWALDPNTGFITSVANPQLCVDIEGNNPQSGSRLVLGNVDLTRRTQRWNWLASSPQIESVAVPNLLISNRDCTSKDGNPIDLEFAGGCQGWVRQPLSALGGTRGGQHHRAEAAVGDD